MEHPGGAEYRRRIESLLAREARLRARLDALEEALAARSGPYALVMEVDGLELLIDPVLLRMPPRVLVRRGAATAEVWLDEDNVALAGPSGFSRFEERRVLELVRSHLDDLRDAWFNLREDDRRGRLEKRQIEMTLYLIRPSFRSSCCATLRILSFTTRSKVKFLSTKPARMSSSSICCKPAVAMDKSAVNPGE
jgi:hypothetical protein